MKKSDVKTFLFYIKKVFDFVLDFIWPQFCIICGREGYVCCGFCLNDILIEEQNKITWPDQNKFYFNDCYKCCDYKNIKKLIKKYKYSYLENIAILLIDILEKQTRRLDLKKNTIIVNVPLHKNKKRKRGFDQTELLAKKLAKRLSLPYYPLLIRIKDNKAQAKLDKKAREKNVLDIFAINKKTALRQAQGGSNILLIDDVTTTGSTLNQAAKILRANNYQKITCLVLAKN